MGLTDDLVRAMRFRMLSALPPDPTGTLGDSDLWSLVAIYVTWRRRVPAAHPRRVHVSRELLANPACERYGDGMTAILKEIAEGDDLRPRMSIAIEDAHSLPVPAILERPRRDPREIDRLLADWGIHHLHLNNVRGKHPDFVKRSRHVLFAAFMPDDAYLIDLRDHEKHGDNWSAKSILETVAANWPDAGIMVRSKFAVGLTQHWNDEQRRELRLAGVSGGLVEIDGNVWSSGAVGQTLTGQPIIAQLHAMKVHWTMSELDANAEIAHAAAEYGLPRDGWTATVHEDQFGFINGRTFHRLGSLVPD